MNRLIVALALTAALSTPGLAGGGRPCIIIVTYSPRLNSIEAKQGLQRPDQRSLLDAVSTLLPLDTTAAIRFLLVSSA